MDFRNNLFVGMPFQPDALNSWPATNQTGTARQAEAPSVNLNTFG